MAALNVHPIPNIYHEDLHVIPYEHLVVGDKVYVCKMNYDDGPYWYYGTIEEIGIASELTTVPLYLSGIGDREVISVKLTHSNDDGDWYEVPDSEGNIIFERRFVEDDDTTFYHHERGVRIYFYRVPAAGGVGAGGQGRRSIRRRRSTHRRRLSKKRRSTRRK